MYSRTLALLLILVILANQALTLADEYFESFVINVYRDGSVSVIASASVHLPFQPPVGYAEVRTTTELGNRVVFEAELSAHLLDTFNGSLSVYVKSSVKPVNQRTMNTTARILFYFEYPEVSLNVNVTRLNITFDVETFVYLFSGEVEVRAAGKAVELLQSIPMAISIIQYQARADPSLRDVLKIRELSYELKEFAIVKFDVELNYDLYLETIARAQATRIKELVKRTGRVSLNCPVDVEAQFNLTRNMVMARYFERVDCNSNTYLNLTRTLLETLVETLYIGGAPAPSYAPGVSYVEPARQVLGKALSLLKAFTEEFEVKPSTASLTLRLDGSKVSIEVRTPRLAKKGAQTPSDTLRALYNFTVNTIRELELDKAGVSIEKLGETRVTIQAEQGVKVKVEGEEVKEAKFADLGRAEVEVEKPREEPVLLYAAVTIVAVGVGVSAYLLLKRR